MYKLTNLDTQEQTPRTGDQLLQTGLPIELKKQPASALFVYERQ
jgi:hypothetical protein